MKLRDYQSECVDAVEAEWEDHVSTLAVKPTGTGKTIVFAHLIKRALAKYPDARVMVIAHRKELLRQAADKIKAVIPDVLVDMEMGDFWADGGVRQAPVIVSSVQTQNAGRNGDLRMKRFDPDQFSMLVIDEAHHAAADSYRRLIDWYKQNPFLRVLGVTATPDRHDEMALGQVFESVAFDWEINDAIKKGWLVPVLANQVLVEGLDFSACRTTAGDLNGADLDEILREEKMLHKVTRPVWELSNGRKTLLFGTSRIQAERMCEILNRYTNNCACYIDGTTPTDQREDLLLRYERGEYQFLVNVGIATEGFDIPGIEVVVPKPTKSRSLFAQMIGRGTRPVPGLVDQHDTPAARREAIESSAKPFMEVIDLCGVAGRHKLIHSADVLGGKYQDETVELATKLASERDGPADMSYLLEQADEQQQARERAQAEKEERDRRRRDAARTRHHVVGKAKFTFSKVSLFDTLDLHPARERQWDVDKQLSDKQKDMLEKQGIDPGSMSYAEGRTVINELFRRWKKHLATPKQIRLLKKHQWYSDELTVEQASSRIDAIAKNNWRKP